MADDERDPVEELLDAALYGPVGLLLALRDRLPELAARGRRHLESRMGVARMVGELAVQVGSRKISEYLEAQRAATVASDRPSAEAAEPEAAAESPTARVPSADELPIPGYPTLAASQVVAHLDGLDGGELELVRAYEVAHRNRKTVLGKVAQLLRAV